MKLKHQTPGTFYSETSKKDYRPRVATKDTFTKNNPYVWNLNVQAHKAQIAKRLAIHYHFYQWDGEPWATRSWENLFHPLYEYHHLMVGSDGWTPDFNQENQNEARLSTVITEIKTLLQQISPEGTPQKRHEPSDARWLSPVNPDPQFLDWMSKTREHEAKHES